MSNFEQGNREPQHFERGSDIHEIQGEVGPEALDIAQRMYRGLGGETRRLLEKWKMAEQEGIGRSELDVLIDISHEIDHTFSAFDNKGHEREVLREISSEISELRSVLFDDKFGDAQGAIDRLEELVEREFPPEEDRALAA